MSYRYLTPSHCKLLDQADFRTEHAQEGGSHAQVSVCGSSSAMHYRDPQDLCKQQSGHIKRCGWNEVYHQDCLCPGRKLSRGCKVSGIHVGGCCWSQHGCSCAHALQTASPHQPSALHLPAEALSLLQVA